MASLSVLVPPLLDYMSHFATAENHSFDGNYKADLAPYLIDVVEPTNAPGPANVA